MLLFEVFHHGIESRTARTVGHGHCVHVKFDGDDTATEEAAHRVGDVEDKGGVFAIVELHFHIDVMPVVEVGSPHLLQRLQIVSGAETARIEFGNAKCQRFPAYDIHFLAALVCKVVLHAHEEIDGDGIWPRYARVEIHGTRHAAEVGVAIDGGHFSSAAVVVAEEDLNEVDIRDGLEGRADALLFSFIISDIP